MEREALGTVPEQNFWRAGDIANCLLALNSSINPGKFWLIEHFDVLRFEWINAGGHLFRKGVMVVTPSMAQEFFFVHDAESITQKYELQSDWDVFYDTVRQSVLKAHPSFIIDEIKSKATFDKISDICLFSIQRQLAFKIMIDEEPEAIFKCSACSEPETAVAEAIIRFA